MNHLTAWWRRLSLRGKVITVVVVLVVFAVIGASGQTTNPPANIAAASTPSSEPTATPDVTAEPTVEPTPEPTPQSTPEATPEPTPEAATAIPIPPSTSGVITFGKNYNPDTLAIVGPATKFKTTSKAIAWSASLSEQAGTTSLTIIVASQSKTGVEKTIINTPVALSNPSFDRLANRIDLALLVNRKAGTYVMRYLRDTTVLAEGTFTLVK